MAKTLRISALQLAAHDREGYAARREALLRLVDQSACGSDLLVLPEATFPAYVLGDAAIDDSEIAAAIELLRAIAQQRRCAIVAGAAVRHGRDLFNSAVVIDSDGSVAGRADKAFLWHFDRKWFSPAERIAPVETSIGSIGALVCADGRMPAIAAALVDRGAELLVMPTAWVTSGRDPANLENVQADLLARVRAFENGVPFVAANKCGVELGMVAYCGKSQIVDASGTVVAMAGEKDQTSISASVELRAGTAFRSTMRPLPAVTQRAKIRPVRVAISVEPLPADIDERLSLLDAELAIGPQFSQGDTALSAIAPVITLEALDAFDPGTLLAARAAGARIAILRTRETHGWLPSIVRARALELRMYVIVFDEGARRAYAVDPDGVLVAGTFGDYRLASFALDARKTLETLVAPGTDIAAGIERIGTLVGAVPAR